MSAFFMDSPNTKNFKGHRWEKLSPSPGQYGSVKFSCEPNTIQPMSFWSGEC